MVSLAVIPNLICYYKTLSRKLVEARQDGRIAADAIVDESRWIIDIDDALKSPEEIIDEELELINNLPKYYKTLIPRWYAQPNYVEIWLEKKAMTGIVKSILHHHDVRIVPTGGWSSYSYERENTSRLLDKIKEGKEVHILYLGDYDPSGLRMEENIINKFQSLGINFRRIAITREQIEEFGLEKLTNPDPDVMAKLQRDPNADNFRKSNGERLYQIEVDALQALKPDVLKNLLISNVEYYFDRDILKKVLSKPRFSAISIRRLVHKKIAELYRILKEH